MTATHTQTELSPKEWNAISAMAAGLPCPAKGRTITSLVARGFIERTPAGWYMLTDAGRREARGA